MQEEQVIQSTSELALHEKIDLFEKQLNIQLTIHDIRGIWPLSFRDHLMPGRRWHRSTFCWEGRFDSDLWAVSCTNDCMRLPHRRCRTASLPYWKKCWKNVWELVVPIARNGQNMLILFAGTFRDEIVDKLPPDIQKMSLKLQKLYRALPLKSSVNEQQLVTALEFFGNALLDAWEHSGSGTEHGNMQEIISSFILQNAAKDITLEDLAKHLSLSKSRAGHAVKQYLGKSFTEALREERMSRAVNLLATHPQISIADLSLSVGYRDPAYFMRLFKRTFNCGPRTYQKKLQNS